MSVLIVCMCKVVLDYQPTTIKLYKVQYNKEREKGKQVLLNSSKKKKC